MKLSRRSVLSAIGISPAAAPMLAAELANHGVRVGAGAASAMSYAAGPAPQAALAERSSKFYDFMTWMRATGNDEHAKNEAQVCHTIDPDIASMRLPMTTKIRWQQERNYKAIMVQREKHWLRHFNARGFVEWYL